MPTLPIQSNCLVIAEVAQSHDGSLGMAHAFIDAAARAGAGAIKFQTHIAAEESTPSEPWRVKFSQQDETRFDYWRRMEFTEAQWHGLRAHADQVRLKFLSSPFSMAAVKLLDRVGVHAWKVASGEVGNHQMLDAMIATRAPVFLSSGMSSFAELDAAVARVRAAGNDLTVMQCTSEYPCPPEKIGLNLIDELRSRYNSKVGLSDHSGTIYPSLAAATLGVHVLEVHVAFSREMFGPDVPASVTFEELKQLTDGVRFIEAMRAHPLDKDKVAAEKQEMRRIFGKSIVVTADLDAGAVLSEDNVALKKPGTGLPPGELQSVLGRRVKRALHVNEQIKREDLE